MIETPRKKKQSTPLSYSVFIILSRMLVLMVAGWVVKLSFTGITWETALQVTSSSRIVGIVAVIVFVIDSCMLVSAFKLLKHYDSEADV